jgi:hypothetical protein
MVAAKVGNYTLVVVVVVAVVVGMVDGIELRIARNECLCSVYSQDFYLMLPPCLLGVVVSQIPTGCSPIGELRRKLICQHRI